MTTKYLQPGNTIRFTNGTGGTLISGAVVKLLHTLGIVAADTANGAEGEAHVEGVFEEVPKVTGAVFVVGEKLLWDVSAGQFDDSAAAPASGDVMGAAVAVRAGANGETTCTIKLTPGNTTLTP